MSVQSDYDRGYEDGYNGRPFDEDGSEDYVSGYNQGEMDLDDELENDDWIEDDDDFYSDDFYPDDFEEDYDEEDDDEDY